MATFAHTRKHQRKNPWVVMAQMKAKVESILRLLIQEYIPYKLKEVMNEILDGILEQESGGPLVIINQYITLPREHAFSCIISVFGRR